MDQIERTKYIENCERLVREQHEAYTRQTAQHECALREHALEVQRIVLDEQLAVMRAICTATARTPARERITVAM